MTATTNGLTALDQVLGYRHPGALRRYCKEHHAPPQEAEDVFQETLKFLYLSYRAATAGPEGFACVISTEIEKIDWMWHVFLLFTWDYADFCERYFGFFLHHVPLEAEEENEAAADENDLRAVLERQFAFVYDVLGEETLLAWYDRCRYAANAPQE
jgi:hypothetical protein